MRERLAVVPLVALALVALPLLAQASPPDPTWVSGVYDAGDYDDVVLTATSTAGATGGVTLEAVETLWVVLGAVVPHSPSRSTASIVPVFQGRAPPGA